MTIRLQEFQRRRRELMEQMEPNSIAILAAAPRRRPPGLPPKGLGGGL